jgi:hypothetical protein
LFESNRVSFAKFSNKTRKRKREREREREGKEEKAPGADFSPQPKNSPWPTYLPP